MAGYIVTCPYCGKENKYLDLEETHGWMECDRCKEVCQVADFSAMRATTAIRVNAFMKVPVPAANARA